MVDRTGAHYRVRQDRVSKAGNVTERYLSRLRHIGLGKAQAGEPVRLLIADDHVRVVGQDGSLFRELILVARRDYQPRLQLVHDVVRQASTMSRGKTIGWRGRIRTFDLLIQSQALASQSLALGQLQPEVLPQLRHL